MLRTLLGVLRRKKFSQIRDVSSKDYFRYSPEDRIKIAQTICRLAAPSPDQEQFLVKALKDTTHTKRYPKMPKPRYVSVSSARYARELSSPSKRVISALAQTSLSRHFESATQALASLCLLDRDRRYALSALKRAYAQKRVSSVAQALSESDDSSERMYEFLRKVMSTHAERLAPLYRAYLITALGPFLKEIPEAREQLGNALRAPESCARVAALELAGKYASHVPNFYPLVRQAAFEETDEISTEVQRSATRALGGFGELARGEFQYLFDCTLGDDQTLAVAAVESIACASRIVEDERLKAFFAMAMLGGISPAVKKAAADASSTTHPTQLMLACVA